MFLREMTLYRGGTCYANRSSTQKKEVIVSRALVAPCTGHQGSPLGARENMSDQVFRYDSMEEYLDPDISGTPVSAEFDTWDKAEMVRDLLRKGENRFYYNIQHTTAVAVIEGEE